MARDVPGKSAAPGLHELPVAVMRGGTSKGVFCHLEELPADGPGRDRFLLALMGSPDPMQLDGLGGTHSSTSKVMAVARGRRPGVDVEYLFAQVGIDRPMVDYAGNCGNLTAAVGPYAFDEGLVAATDNTGDGRTRQLILLNLNTGVQVRSTFEIHGGKAAWAGDCAIDGVPGTGAPVVTDYLNPAGSVTGKLFPTGSPITIVDGLQVSLVDVATPYAFVRAPDLGLHGDESPDALNADPQLLARLERLRSACGVAMGVASAAVPRLVIVSPPAASDERPADIRVQATSMQKVHHASPMTAALCTAAAVHLRGTVAAEMAEPFANRGGSHPCIVRMRHPKGLVEATIDIDGDQVRSAGVVRTARRLLTGTAYVPQR